MEYPSYNPSSSNSSIPPRAAATSSSSTATTPVPYTSSDYAGGRHISYGSNYSGPEYNQQSYLSGSNPYPNQPYHYQSQNNSATLNQLLQPNSNFPRSCQQQTYNSQSYGYENYNWNQYNRNPSESSHNAYPNFSMSHNTVPMSSHRFSESGNTYDGRNSQQYPSAFTNTSMSDSQSGSQHTPVLSTGYGNTSWSGGGGEPSTTPSVPANPHQPLTEPVSPAPAPRANDALERSEVSASVEKADTPVSTPAGSAAASSIASSSVGLPTTSVSTISSTATTGSITQTATTQSVTSNMVSPSPHPSSRSTTPAASSPMPRPPSSGRPPSNQSVGAPSNSGMITSSSSTNSGGQPAQVQGVYPNVPPRAGMIPHYPGKPSYGAVGPHSHPGYGASNYNVPGQHMMTRLPHPGTQQMAPYPPTQHSTHPSTSEVSTSIPASLPGPANYAHAPNYSTPHHSHLGSQVPQQPLQSPAVGPPNYSQHIQSQNQQPSSQQQPNQQPPPQQQQPTPSSHQQQAQQSQQQQHQPSQQQQPPPSQPQQPSQMPSQMMSSGQPNSGSQMVQGGIYNPGTFSGNDQYRQHQPVPRRSLLPPSNSGLPPYGMHPSNMPMHMQGHPHVPPTGNKPAMQGMSMTPSHTASPVPVKTEIGNKQSDVKDNTSDGSMCGTPSAQPMSVGSTGSAGADIKDHTNSVAMGGQPTGNSNAIYTNTNSNDGVRSKVSSSSTPKAESHPPTPASMHMPSPSQVSNMSSYHDDMDSNSMMSSPGVQSVQQHQPPHSQPPHMIPPPPTPVHTVQPPVSSSSSHSSSMSNVRMKMIALGSEAVRPQWVDHYLKFMEEIGRPVSGLPMVSKQTLDLFKFYMAVRERGGLLEVAKNKRWKDVSIAININASASAAYTLRRNYVKYLLDFECRYDRGGIDPRPIIQQVDSMSSKKKKAAAANQNSNANASQPTSVPPPTDYHSSHGPAYTHPSHPHMGPHHGVPSHPSYIQQNGTPQQPRYPVPPPPQHHPSVYPNGHPSGILPPPRGPSPLPPHYGPPGAANPPSNSPGAWRHPYPPNQSIPQQGLPPHMMSGSHQPSLTPGQTNVNGPSHHNSGYSQSPMGSQPNMGSNIPQSSYQTHQPLPQSYGQSTQAPHQPGQSSSQSQYGNGPPPPPSVAAPQHGGMQAMPPGYRTNIPSIPPHSSNSVSNCADIQQPFHPSQNSMATPTSQGSTQQPPMTIQPQTSLPNSHQAPGQQYPVSSSGMVNSQSGQSSMSSVLTPQGHQLGQAPQSDQLPAQNQSQLPPHSQQQSVQPPAQTQSQSQAQQPPPSHMPPHQQSPSHHPIPPSSASSTSSAPPQSAQHQISQLQQLVRSCHSSNSNGGSGNMGASINYRPPQTSVNYHQQQQPQQQQQSPHQASQQHHGSKPPQALIQMLSNSDSTPRRDWPPSSTPSSMGMTNTNMVHHHPQISAAQQRMYGSQPQSNMNQTGSTGMGRHPPGVPVSSGMPPPPSASHLASQSIPPPPPPPPPPPQGVMSGAEIMPPPPHAQHSIVNSSAKHPTTMYMYKMTPPRLEAPLFPSNSVEATQPKYIKRRKYTHKEIAPINAWKMLMALKSGLPTEIAWGLDCLNILLYDETTFPYFGLMHLPGLLEVLVNIWRHDISEVFDLQFESSVSSHDNKIASNSDKDVKSSKSLTNRENGITNISVPSSKEEWISWFRSLTREDVLSRVKRLSRQERNYTYCTRDGVSVKLVENGHTRVNLKKLLNQLVTTLETRGEKAGCEVKACLPISPDDVDYIAPMMESGKSEEKLRSYFLPALTRKKEKLTGKGEMGATAEGNAAVGAASRLKRQSKLVAVAASSPVVDNSASNERRCMCDASSNIDGGESRFAKEIGEDTDSSKVRPHDCHCERLGVNDSETLATEDYDSSISDNTDEPSCKRMKLEPKPDPPDETSDSGSDNDLSDEEMEDPPVPVELAVIDELICSNNCIGTIHETLFSHVSESEEIQLQRCLVVSNILRNLSFLSVNEREIVAHMGVMRVLGRLLLLGHEHPTKGKWSDKGKLNSKCWRKRWWVEAIRENVLVTLVNVSGVLQMGVMEENVVRPILEGVMHLLMCPASDNIDPFPGHSLMSPQRLALEIMVRLTVHVENVDLIMATLPPFRCASSESIPDCFSKVPSLESVLETLCELLVRPDQIIREMALSVISYMVRAGEGTAAVVLTRCKPSPIMSLVDFVEAIESNAARIVSSGGGVPALRRNPDIMGTSLDMLRRAARILNDLSRVDDNLSLFVDYQERLLTLSMSLVLDQYVAHMLMGVLFNLQEWTKTQTEASSTTLSKR